MDIAETRRKKLAQLLKERGIRQVASRAALNWQSLDQVIKCVLLPPKKDGSRAPRSLGSAMARRIEASESLPDGWFDEVEAPPVLDPLEARRRYAIEDVTALMREIKDPDTLRKAHLTMVDLLSPKVDSADSFRPTSRTSPGQKKPA